VIHLPASVRVYLCLSPRDMRKSFDSLHALVRDHLEWTPMPGIWWSSQAAGAIG
jgi:transposase